MRYTPGFDKPLLEVGRHGVMYDRLQIVVKHPTACPRAGSGLDRHKTFHPWQIALSVLEGCGEAPTQDQIAIIKAKGLEVAAVAR